MLAAGVDGANVELTETLTPTPSFLVEHVATLTCDGKHGAGAAHVAAGGGYVAAAVDATVLVVDGDGEAATVALDAAVAGLAVAGSATSDAGLLAVITVDGTVVFLSLPALELLAEHPGAVAASSDGAPVEVPAIAWLADGARWHLAAVTSHGPGVVLSNVSIENFDLSALRLQAFDASTRLHQVAGAAFVPSVVEFSPYTLAVAGMPLDGGCGDSIVLWAIGGPEEKLVAVDGLSLPGGRIPRSMAASTCGRVVAIEDEAGAVHYVDAEMLVAVALPQEVSGGVSGAGVAALAFAPVPAFLSASTESVCVMSPASLADVDGGDENLTFDVALTAGLIPLSTATARDAVYVAACSADRLVVSIHAVREGVPRFRLNTLLLASAYAEAEAFAAEHGLDGDLVRQAQIEAACVQVKAALAAAGGDEAARQVASEAFVAAVAPLLQAAANVSHAVSFCVHGAFDSADATLALLNIGYELAKSADDESLITLVTDALARLASFEIIASSEAGSSSGWFSGKQWQRFRSAPALGIVRMLVAESKMAAAILVWSRHYAHATTSSDVLTLINQIPEDVGVDEYLEWLQAHLFVRISPSDRPALEAWVEQRARSVELREERPHGALKLASSLASFIKAAAANESTAFGWTPGSQVAGFMSQLYNVRQAASTGLTRLVAQLADMVRLFDEHDLGISLRDYAAETPSSIAVLMIERVVPDALPAELATHVRPYLLAHGLDADQELVNYLVAWLDAAALAGNAALATEDAELRALALLNGVVSTSAKMQATLEFFRRIPIPWSADIEALMSSTASWEGDGAAELAEQVRLLRLKAMFLRYGLREVNLSDAAKAKDYLFHILTRLECETAMADGLLVVEAYSSLKAHDAYIFHLQALLASGKVVHLARAGELFASLPLALQLSVGQELVLWIQARYEALRIGGEAPGSLLKLVAALRALLEVCVAAEAKVRAAALTAPSASESAAAVPARRTRTRRVRGAGLLRRNASNASNDKSGSSSTVAQPFVYLDVVTELSGAVAQEALLAEFGVALPLATLNDSDAAREALAMYVASMRQSSADGGDASKKGATSINKTRLYRMVELLGLARSDLEGVLAHEAAVLGDPVRATALCKELLLRNRGARAAETLTSVADTLLHHTVGSKVVASAPSRARNLVQTSLSVCADDDVLALLDKFRAAEQVAEVVDQARSVEACAPEEEVTNLVRGAYPSHYHEGGLELELERRSSKGKGKEDDEHDENEAGAEAGAVAGERLTPGGAKKQLATMLKQNGWVQSALKVQLELARTRSGSPGESEIVGLHSALLDKVLGSRRLDRELAVSYMCALPYQTGHTTFQMAASRVNADYGRLGVLASIGQDVAYLWKQHAFEGSCEKLRANARWWAQLALLDIPFDAKSFNCGPSARYQASLVPQLLRKTGHDIETVLEFTETYAISDQAALEHYITVLLVGDDSASSSSGGSGDGGKVGPYSLLYQEQVARVVGEMQPDGLLETLNSRVLPFVSEYDYDRIRFVYELIDKLVGSEEEARAMVEVVKGLQRYAKVPTDEVLVAPLKERVAAGEARALGSLRVVPQSVLEEWELTRLPFFTLIENPLLVLKPQLNPATVRKLIPLARHLEVSEDALAIELIENVMSALAPAAAAVSEVDDEIGGENADPNERRAGASPSKASKETGKRNSGDARSAATASSGEYHYLVPAAPGTSTGGGRSIRKTMVVTFEALRVYLNKISETARAIEVGEWVASQFPLGKDRLKAYEFCCTLAAKFRRETRSSSEAVALVERLKRAEKETDVALLLVDNQLTAFLDYVSQPEELVCQLYFQLGAAEFLRESRGLSNANLHYVADNIAGKFKGEVDEERTREQLVQLWLSEDDPSTYEPREEPLPAALVASRAFLRSHGFGPEWEVLMRIAFILQYEEDVAKKLGWLLNYAFQDKSLKISSLSRAKALQLVFALAPAELIERAYPGSSKELASKLESFLYLSEFERVRFPYTMAELSTENKEGLPETLELAVKLAIDHEVVDGGLWIQFLERALARRATPLLLRSLEFVAAQPVLASLPIMSEVWQFLVDAAEAADEAVASPRELLAWLRRCPFLVSLDLSGLVASLAGRGEVGLALAAAKLVPSPAAREALIAAQLAGQSHAARLALLKSVDDALVVDAVVTSVVAEANYTGIYDEGVPASALQAIVAGAVAQGDVLPLVRATLEAKHAVEARQIVAFFCEQQPEAEGAKAVASDDGDALENFLMAVGNESDFDLLLAVGE
ncbi:uncharacterized protein AMSG_04261 [Thecamonas trahens ATCC 50062]|uniref:Uncharacterized protein n=1 Tax=Thecamonas trahens ATCC 50062 TaxID=461836 RepID=A0A0L0D9Q1_THETB|nr:hypothetical protein AMSG_04261 [Thecamonas trahens ATCC 50062]KNC48028.1 hypothetical protein AMSG_04261 [Thecamonas trahens ATCC 50062]|eukprot:XP_013759043.1 hypothetical protein AMSG_04261 [Thecamonas trahens ATCC 50062]